MGESTDGVGPLLDFDLSNKFDAIQAMAPLEQAYDRLLQQRATIGSFQARTEIGINNIESTVQNFISAESKIRDADIAEASALLVKNSILQQAATAILAQANTQPQIALQLLA